METLQRVLEKLAEAGPLGLCLAIILAIMAVVFVAVRRLYSDNQTLHREASTDAKEYARGLAAGLATLDATQELVKDLLGKPRGRR